MTDTTGTNAARAFYDRISKVYDALSDSSEKGARDTGLAALAVTEGEVVLEIGFGTGHALVDLARAAGTSGHVHGLDISPGMFDVAHKRLEKEGLTDRVSMKAAEAPPLPYDDDTFDAVFMSFTLELFPVDDGIPVLLAEVRRVLKSGGRLGVVAMATTPAGEHESALTHTYKWMHSHFPHIVDCQPIDVRRHVADAGFEAIEETDLEMWTLRVAAVTARNT